LLGVPVYLLLRSAKQPTKAGPVLH
jgi:hypothetical protein